METLLIIIIALTGIVSFITWQHSDWFEKLLYKPYDVYNHKQYYRLISHAFLHGGWMHLLINMLVLYSFGRVVLIYFSMHPSFSGFASGHFLILYFGSILFSSLFSLAKYRNDSSYSAVGASGAVSAVVFTSIFFVPWQPVYFFAVLPIPGIIFGAIYLAYSYYMDKKGKDNVGHDAHFWGAVFGFAYPMMVNPALIQEFFTKLLAVNM
ncbi:MAG: rhomboid family intramembrane serine protease [Bacteroidales bacterium]